MVRPAKPYQRSDDYRKGNPDAPGSWKHDLHGTAKGSLASRLSSSTSGSGTRTPGGASLLSRISGGQGKELLSSGAGVGSNVKLHGFDGPVPANPNNLSNLNAGLELLPSSGPARGKAAGGGGLKSGSTGGRLLDRSGIDAALGRNGQSQRRDHRPARELLPQQSHQSQQSQQVYQQPQQHVSIMGAARAATWVRVDNLAAGTTAEDVLSAFGHLPVLNAKAAASASAANVAVDIELETRAAAEELIKQYHGVVADGNTLSVTLVSQSLKDRFGGGAAPAVAAQTNGRNGSGGEARPSASSAGRELLGAPSSGKLYSDTILSSKSSANVMTLASENGTAGNQRSQRSDAWLRGGPSLAQRLDGGRGQGRRGGRGQIGGGSFHDMLID